jgi:hypothetical protein
MDKIFDRVQVIPPGGKLLFYVSQNTVDADLRRIREELHDFFGSDRKIGVVRSGDVEVIYFADTDPLFFGVSTEGASWAMEGAYG